jgi:hypothetical protein
MQAFGERIQKGRKTHAQHWVMELKAKHHGDSPFDRNKHHSESNPTSRRHHKAGDSRRVGAHSL